MTASSCVTTPVRRSSRVARAEGFVLMADARRALRELVAYDAAGRELERTDVSYIGRQRVCFDERSCPPGRLVGP